MSGATQPTFYLPHGGGPCFFMVDPAGVWTAMAAFLASVPARLPATPRAILIVSGHWETDGFVLTGAARPPLIYDYYNFPPHTYALRYDVPGDPALAARAAGLLQATGLDARVDPDRGLDHGVFVPLKVAFPDAAMPVVELSLDRRLDPALHLRAGAALAPLRDDGVLILGTGMSFHNMSGFRDPAAGDQSAQFEAWLTAAMTGPPAARNGRLEQWATAPSARLSHPAEEHLLPAMVAAGAADGAGDRVFAGHLGPVAVSGYRFD